MRITLLTLIMVSMLLGLPNYAKEPIKNAQKVESQLKPLSSTAFNNSKRFEINIVQLDYRVIKDVLVTHYDALCDTGCTGITATGINVRHTITTPKGYGIIAVDPKVIPLHSLVEMGGKLYKAEDTGGAIDGKHIDVLVKSRTIALEKGKKHEDIRIIQPNQ